MTIGSTSSIRSSIARQRSASTSSRPTCGCPIGLQKRIVDYAHAQGKPVTSHEIYPAVAFGIDGVEHLRGTSRRGYSPKLSSTNRAYQDVIDLLAKSGVTLTPTIGIQGAFRARATRRQGAALRPAAGAVSAAGGRDAGGPRRAATQRRARSRGEAVRGDVESGGRRRRKDRRRAPTRPSCPTVWACTSSSKSYVHAGLTPFQALQTATANAAQALGLGDEIGTIEPGKIADLAFVGGDPLVDIRSTRDVKRVMKGGRMLHVSDLVKR